MTALKHADGRTDANELKELKSAIASLFARQAHAEDQGQHGDPRNQAQNGPMLSVVEIERKLSVIHYGAKRWRKRMGSAWDFVKNTTLIHASVSTAKTGVLSDGRRRRGSDASMASSVHRLSLIHI